MHNRENNFRHFAQTFSTPGVLCKMTKIIAEKILCIMTKLSFLCKTTKKKSALCTNRARGRIGREGWAEAHLCKTTKLNTFLLLVIMTKLFQKSRSEKIFVQIAENKYS